MVLSMKVLWESHNCIGNSTSGNEEIKLNHHALRDMQITSRVQLLRKKKHIKGLKRHVVSDFHLIISDLQGKDAFFTFILDTFRIFSIRDFTT